MMLNKETDLPDELERVVLEHVELYRLTLVVSVQRLFFPDEKHPGESTRHLALAALEELVRRGKLAKREFPKAALATNRGSYYVAASVKAAKPADDAQGINFDLQTLWLATLRQHRCYRLTKPEITKLFPKPPHHHVRHVVGDVGDGPFVGRVYPSAVPVKETVARLKQFIGEARVKHELNSWMESGDYGFFVLGSSQRRVDAFTEALTSRRQGAGAIADQVRIQVEFAPTVDVVSQALEEV